MSIRRSSKVALRRRLNWEEDGADLSTFEGPDRIGGPPKSDRMPAPSSEGDDGNNCERKATPNQTRKEKSKKKHEQPEGGGCDKNDTRVSTYVTSTSAGPLVGHPPR